MFEEPPATQADIHFHVLGIPVRVHPFFWIVALLMSGMSGIHPKIVLVWIVALFTSILVHELGHALMAIYFGSHCRIVLHGFGGLAIHSPPVHLWWQRIAIALAGPLAGFLLAALVLALLLLGGFGFSFGFAAFGVSFPGKPITNLLLDNLIYMMLYINIFWGLINLLPVSVLDGGHVAQQLLMQYSPHNGLRLATWLSVFAGSAAALYLLSLELYFVALFFGAMAYSSYQQLMEIGEYR